MSTDDDTDALARRLTERLDRLAERMGSVEHAEALADTADEPADQVADWVAELRSPLTWSEPPAGLRDSVLAAAVAEQPAALRTAEPSPEPTPISSRQRPGRRRLLWAVPVAAVAASVLTFASIQVDDALNKPDLGRQYPVAGTSLAPDATAKVSVASKPAGFSVVLDAHGLPAAAAGSYYAAWLRGPRGTVPLGSFHARKTGKPITMWSGVDPKVYPRFSVTLQREGAPLRPSRLVVLRATLGG